MKKIYLIALLMLLPVLGFSQTQIYKSSKFSIRSNGIQDNTTSIQGAIDFIAANGGGTLEFSVGRYLTGAVELKSGVNIKLLEGAVIVGSTNIHSYKGHPAIFWAENQKNIVIEGQGVFDGRGPELLEDIEDQKGKKHVASNVAVPSLVSFKNCSGITLQGFILRNSANSTPVAEKNSAVEKTNLSFE